ncbi:MAG: hypothetical protein KatS3mg068_1818 [Candidatus Sericytochromatia bacterium]|nr:MAG: hypothetical protein KatS3mg068_1818 [Candidatus Sericytochromatia bacterium]
MISKNEEISQILNKYKFNWDLIDVTIGGKSPIDLQSLSINNLDDATKFLDLYGYNIFDENINIELKKHI